ncbi:MAG: chromosome segregation protein SMC [Lachnospiraceae bacterium]|nr:chromosome segregation protein SMC [Lachnospiraceae bacterium]
MYLKSIEVQGFKSFANKITFKFHNGITGIVGPNGSGKSNVADAVRWVLGEQKVKQLRGASMQDVIFSGTEMRKPLGYAYVAITLDNRDRQLSIDFEEVTVARRLYRSGESEYMINNSPCRLKDVYELFYDTGIGKEGYSIIGQGQIDKILSGKPEERRELFDEAAGIVKFKRRKAASVKKLESEQQNLLRVSDILAELEKQTGPLERQSEKARIYLKKKEELKTLDVNMFLLDNRQVNEQLVKVEENYRTASRDLAQTTEKYEHIKTEYEEIQQEVERLGAEIEKAHAELTDTSAIRGKLEGEIGILREQIHSVEGNKEHLLNRLAAVEADIAEKSSDKSGIMTQKASIDEQVAKLETARDEARERLEEVQAQMEQLNTEIENAKNVIMQALNDRADTRSRMERFDTMLEQTQIRKAELTSRLVRVKSDEAEADQLVAELEDQFEETNKKVTQLNEKQAAAEKRLLEIKGLLTEDNRVLQETKEKYHQEKSRLDALNNLTERYEGYGGSVKMVMEQKKTEKGIVGVVADIIKVEKKYETAIETALGGNIQNIVTEEEDTAKRMIAFLKKHKYGRATFLPLTSIRHPQEFKNQDVLKEAGVIGMADKLVRIDEKYRNVAKAMLGRIVVVDDVNHALAIAKKYAYGVRMVTLEGELLVPGGAISGGAFKNNSNLLGRRRELEELGKKVKELSEKTESLEREIQNIREERNKLRVQSETLRVTLQNAFIEQNTIRLNLEAAKEKKEETANGFGDLKTEEAQIEETFKEIETGKEEIRKKLQASEALEQEENAKIGACQKKLEELRTLESDYAAKAAEWDVEVEKMLQKQEFGQQNVDRIDAEIERHRKEKQEIEESMAAGAEEAERKRHNIEEIRLTIEASQKAQSDAEKKLQEDTQQRELLSEKQKTFFDRREELSGQMTGLDKEVYRLNAQKEKLEESIETQINYMWNEYEITLSDAASLRKEELTDLAEMKRDIAALKDQIKKLGDVNVNAIEDYKNIMERYTFLKGQHDDLIEAEKTLEHIITELDTAMRRQFQEKFKEIAGEFDKVFKELFGGGKGTLELMEDEDILEAGIRIIAQPPGKKLQNMMQLSGGEKALTAIALLFAIQNLKPSPFCLLDEIEAALDENNVTRFANYLHKLTKNTQFIVITHRRGTMEKADQLYGITMQEKGVSALVSVDLIDKELDD